MPLMDLMRQELGLRPTEARRVLRRAPQALLRRGDGTTPSDTIQALHALGIKPKMVGLEVIRYEPSLRAWTVYFAYALAVNVAVAPCHTIQALHALGIKPKMVGLEVIR
jgi:hypothetical protein